MEYVVDTSSFIVMGNYFPSSFPSYWELFNGLVSSARIFSTREVRKEIDRQIAAQHLADWVDKNKDLFVVPEAGETSFVG